MNNRSAAAFWQSHLAAGAQDLHLVASSSCDSHAIRLAAEELGFRFFQVDLSSVRAVHGIFDAFARAMSFPSYFGWNWDALSDLLRDLSWCSAPGYVLLLTGVEGLQSVPVDQLSILASVLRTTIDHWQESGEGGASHAGTTLFHVIVCGDRSSFPSILMQLVDDRTCAHDVETR